MLAAKFYSNDRPQQQDVAVELLADGKLQFKVEDKLHYYSFEELRISDRLGKSARFISLPEGQLETFDNDQLDQWLKEHGKTSSSHWLHVMESHWRMAIGGIVLTLFIVIFGYLKGIPWAAEKIAFWLPPSIMNQAGEQSLDILERLYVQPTTLSEQRQEDIREQFVQVAKAMKLDPDNYDLRFYASEEFGANAFALPNGVIIVLDEAAHLSTRPEMLNTVLAHEIGHIELRHSMRQVIEGSLIAIAFGVMVGDISAVSEIVLTTPLILAQAKFSRDMESEADAYALQYMKATNTPVDAFADMLTAIVHSHTHEPIIADQVSDPDKSSSSTAKPKDAVENTKEEESSFDLDLMSDEEEEQLKEKARQALDYLSTHPGLEERIEALRNQKGSKVNK